MAKQRRKRRTTDEAVDEQVARMRTLGCSFGEIKRATGAKREHIISDWTEASIDPNLRKTVFVETLEQLREVIRGLYPMAAAGHVPSVLALNRVWGRRNQMLGLKTPEQSIVRIIDESAPKPGNVDEPHRRSLVAVPGTALASGVARLILGGGLRSWNASINRSSPPSCRPRTAAS